MVKGLQRASQIAVLAVVFILLCLALPAATDSSSAQTIVDRVIIERGSVSSGGNYRLVNETKGPLGASSGWDYQLPPSAGGAAQISIGGAYRLIGSQAPTSSENGCCCIHLPCVIKGD